MSDLEFKEKRKKIQKSQTNIIDLEDSFQSEEPNNILIEQPGQAQSLKEKAKVFMDESFMGRSEEFVELKDLLSEAYKGDASFAQKLKRGELSFKGEEYRFCQKLYEAAENYITTHATAKSSVGESRYLAARSIRQAIDRLSERTLMSKGKVENEQDMQKFSQEEREFAEENIKKFIKPYRAYSKQVGEDMVSSNEEKLRARWNMLKTCERDIRIYTLMHKAEADASDGLGDICYIIDEYRSVKLQMRLLSLAKQSGEKAAFKYDRGTMIDKHAKEMMGEEPEKKDNEEISDEGLSKRQLAGLEKIDHWVLRNIRNGGYMTFGLNVSDRTDFASRLMNLSKRERLYAYYLVQTRERINPSGLGIVLSQTGFVPNLKEFKDHMIATKLKFYTRFSGGYVYWNKLAEAVSIAGAAKEPLKLMYKANKLIKEKKEGSVEEEDQSISEDSFEKQLDESIEEQKDERLEDSFAEYMKKKEKGVSFDDSDDEDEDQQGQSVTDKLQKKKSAPKKGTQAASVAKDYFSTAAGDLKGFATAPKGLTVFDKNFLSAFNTYATNAGLGLDVVSNLVGGYFNIKNMSQNHKSMTWLDFTASAVDVAANVGKIATSGAKLAKLFVTNPVIEGMTSMTGTTALNGAALLSGGIKTVSYFKNGYFRKKASSIAKSRNGDTNRFQEGMLKLNRKIGVRQRVSSLTAFATGAATTAVSALIMVGSLAAPVLAAVTAAAFGVGIAKRIKDKGYEKSQSNALNDTFFGTEEVLEKVTENWQNDNKRYISPEQKAKLKKQLRRRMAASLGYYSPSHASGAVAKQYANYLLEGSKKDDKEGQMCVAMIRGLGLSISKKKGVPTESDIAKKLK